MIFSKLVDGLCIIECSQRLDAEIDSIVYDSRKARQGSLFVCIDGFVTDGHKFIKQAVKQGVSAILIQKEISQLEPEQAEFLNKTAWARISDTRSGLAFVSDRFFDHPAGKLKMIGVTGTKGKTTTTFMIKNILEASGQKAGLIGTVANMIGERTVFASRTTPESYDLQALLDEMVSVGLDSCVMEVSSQGLKLDRVSGCSFQTGVFTNLYEDHIGPSEHDDMEDYLQSKLKLFSISQHVVVNRDIDVFSRVRQAAGDDCLTYGLDPSADVRASNLRKLTVSGKTGTQFKLVSPWYNTEIFVGMPGLFNVSNALAAITACGIYGVDEDSVLKGLAEVNVPGRVQSVQTGSQFQVIVDYAHNAASLEHLLHTLREYTTGRLITVFGCGGDRAKSRRFEMGEVSGRLSDFSIITSDNPRTEDPEAIINDILTGIKPTGGRHTVVIDRRDAIEYAIDQAASGDMIVIAGKGHENYQIFKDRTIHFDDAETAALILADRSRQ